MLRWKRHRLCDAGHSVQLTLTRDTWLQATLTGSYNYGKESEKPGKHKHNSYFNILFYKGIRSAWSYLYLR